MCIRNDTVPVMTTSATTLLRLRCRTRRHIFPKKCSIIISNHNNNIASLYPIISSSTLLQNSNYQYNSGGCGGGGCFPITCVVSWLRIRSVAFLKRRPPDRSSLPWWQKYSPTTMNSFSERTATTFSGCSIRFPFSEASICS